MIETLLIGAIVLVAGFFGLCVVILREDRRIVEQRLKGADAMNTALQAQLGDQLAADLPLYEGDCARNFQFVPLVPCKVCGRPVLDGRDVCEKHA